MPLWNPWHGCHKLSAGCRHCYVYRIDEKHGRDSFVVTKTRNFGFPVRRTRTGTYKIPAGSTVFTCFSSDFFVEEADPWRPEAWEMIRERSDLHFFMITKRIDRLEANPAAGLGSGIPSRHDLLHGRKPGAGRLPAADLPECTDQTQNNHL